jgi:predicted nucleotidyltransferase
MKITKITQDKIMKAIELVCPLLREKLIIEAYIVGSVAKGTARVDSDIDLYLINPDFKKQKDSYNIHLIPEPILDDETYNLYTNNIIEVLKNLGATPKYLKTKHEMLWMYLYKDEIFHFMYDYESESIKSAGEYIEIDKDLCE